MIDQFKKQMKWVMLGVGKYDTKIFCQGTTGIMIVCTKLTAESGGSLFQWEKYQWLEVDTYHIDFEILSQEIHLPISLPHSAPNFSLPLLSLVFLADTLD